MRSGSCSSQLYVSERVTSVLRTGQDESGSRDEALM